MKLKHKTKLSIVLAAEFVAIAVVILLVFLAGKKSYTVTFDLNGGTLLSGDTEQVVSRGGNATAPVVTKDGCYLHSWSASYVRVTKDVTVKAIWEYETTVGINYVSEEDSNYCEIVSAFPDIQGDVYIGAYHNGKKVLGIRDGAFKNCTGITNVYMLDGIITIGSGVFEGCTSLKTITLPSTLTKLGDKAFYGCESLESLKMPTELKNIGMGAFAGCVSLSEIEFNEKLLSLGDIAFSGCTSLTEAMLPDSVVLIGTGAFYGCTSLKKVFLPQEVKAIGIIAFDTAGAEILTPVKESEKPGGWSSNWRSADVVVLWETERPEPLPPEAEDEVEDEDKDSKR